MHQPLTAERAAWRDAPVTYIRTTGDMTVPLDYQNVFMKGMEEVGVKVQRVSINTGHCPNLTRPREIAKIVQKIANREAVGYKEDEQRLAEGARTKDVEGGIKRVDATDA